MEYIKKFIKEHNLAIIIVVTFIIGLSGGLIGGAAARVYDPLFGFFPFGNLDFSGGRYAGQGLVISNAKNVIVQQDAKIDETIGSVSSSLVGIYRKKPAPAKPNAAFTLDNFYKINEPSGQGFIITSDGWIVTNLSLVKNYHDFVVITKDKKIYQIDQASVDNLTKFNFIHVLAHDLPARKLAEIKDIKEGSLAIGVNWLGFNLVSSVSGFSESSGLVKSSDNFFKKIILKDKLPPEYKGSIISNLAGDALGLVNDEGEIEPLSHLSGAIKSLFKNKTIARPSLGLNYIELNQLVKTDGQNSVWQRGAIIYKEQKSAAVNKSRPVERSGLREGDIIISIDDLELNEANNLTDLIQNHLAGETISLLILRGGGQKEVRATLAELK